jgi:hypothetical protein
VSEPSTLKNLSWAAYALLLGAAAVVVTAFLGVVIGIVVVSTTHLVRGEAAAWFGFFTGGWGLMVGLVIGPLVSLHSLHRKFAIARKATLIVASTIIVGVPVAEFIVLHTPSMTGPSAAQSRTNIEAVSNDGAFLILRVENANGFQTLQV